MENSAIFFYVALTGYNRSQSGFFSGFPGNRAGNWVNMPVEEAAGGCRPV